MTTLIDRILSQIIPAFVDYNLRTKKHIIEYGDTPETFQLAEDRLNIEKQLEYNLRQIIEAELTAVKGDVCTACYGKKGYSVFHQDNSKDDFTGKDLGKGKTWESLETCPRCNGTGEEPKKPEKPEIMLQPGQYMRDNEGNITTYEDEQKEKPESECNCKGGRHCEVCRKADYVGAGTEKIKQLEQTQAFSDTTTIRNKVNEIIDFINNKTLGN